MGILIFYDFRKKLNRGVRDLVEKTIEEKWIAVKKYYEASYQTAFKNRTPDKEPFEFKARLKDQEVSYLYDQMVRMSSTLNDFYFRMPYLEEKLNRVRGLTSLIEKRGARQ